MTSMLMWTTQDSQSDHCVLPCYIQQAHNEQKQKYYYSDCLNFKIYMFHIVFSKIKNIHDFKIKLCKIGIYNNKFRYPPLIHPQQRPPTTMTTINKDHLSPKPLCNICFYIGNRNYFILLPFINDQFSYLVNFLCRQGGLKSKGIRNN